MSGVRIHKFSELDWLKQQEESKLTVPGSYWLCHKNSIYKFIFVYHPMMRHFKEFIYEKDLMKVIRRIIKSKPCQGQQFCTKHILVTYNHSSWTRQDKMFAILKFMKHTEVTVVSRAMVLTVQVKDEIYEFKTLKRDKIKHLENENKKERRNSNIYEMNKRVNHFNLSPNMNKHVNNLNLNDDSNNLALLSLNDGKTKDKLDIIKYNESDSSNVLTDELVNIEKKDVNKTSNCSIMFRKIEKKKDKFHNDMKKRSSLNLIEFEELMQQDKTKLELNDNAMTQGSSTINSNNEGIVDSANLPYQYFIEKEIENAKKSRVKYTSSNVKKSVTINEESSEDSRIMSDNKYVKQIVEENNVNDKYCTKHEVPEILPSNEEQRTKNLSDSKELLLSCDKINKGQKLKRIEESGKKTDDGTVKSSNITDLIMKGRMLMIQQDQDSVSVVEQITKSDIDEVLENSEKFETELGEKCLLNSSLLKLENLVTMIDMPKETIKNNEIKDKINNIKSLSKLIKKYSVNNERAETHINMMNPSTSMFNLQDSPVSSKSCLEYKEYESIMNNFENGKNDTSSKIQFWDNEFMNMFDTTLNSSPTLDIKDYSIVESVIDDSENHISNNDSKSVENISSSNTSSIPRIISDQIVTLDQIPLGLQEIVKEKLSKRYRSINRESNSDNISLNDTSLNDTILMSPNESTNLEIKSFETDLFKVEEDLMPLRNNSEIEINDACSNITVMEKTRMASRKRKRSYNNDDDKKSTEMDSDEIIPFPKRKTYSSLNKKGKHKKEKEDSKYNTKMLTDVVKVRNSSMPNNKLQDITEEFYQDLMQHNDCSNKCDKKSLYLETDIKGNDTRIEMLKFIEDITRGVKVVVKRININNNSSIIGDSSSSLACIN